MLFPMTKAFICHCFEVQFFPWPATFFSPLDICTKFKPELHENNRKFPKKKRKTAKLIRRTMRHVLVWEPKMNLKISVILTSLQLGVKQLLALTWQSRVLETGTETNSFTFHYAALLWPAVSPFIAPLKSFISLRARSLVQHYWDFHYVARRFEVL